VARAVSLGLCLRLGLLSERRCLLVLSVILIQLHVHSRLRGSRLDVAMDLVEPGDLGVVVVLPLLDVTLGDER
jgi:hypothetical protein